MNQLTKLSSFKEIRYSLIIARATKANANPTHCLVVSSSLKMKIPIRTVPMMSIMFTMPELMERLVFRFRRPKTRYPSGAMMKKSTSAHQDPLLPHLALKLSAAMNNPADRQTKSQRFSSSMRGSVQEELYTIPSGNGISSDREMRGSNLICSGIGYCVG